MRTSLRRVLNRLFSGSLSALLLGSLLITAIPQSVSAAFDEGSADALLTGLSLSDGTLSPVFDSETAD
ncbi:hypothetical protein K0U00_36720, partial [Paenibacillus sepulcri]|nr:hypothetical protein [Paenibacillus sepulcri]